MSTKTRGLLHFAVIGGLTVCFAAQLGCFFDPKGVASDSDGGQSNNATQDGGTAGDGDVVDARPDVYVPPCTGDTYECLPDGSAQVCQDNAWVAVGACPLGCDAVARRCHVPSNVPGDWFDNATDELVVGVADSIVTLFTDTGQIAGANGQIRPPVEGLDALTGIYYERQPQGANPGLGVFVMTGLDIADGATVTAVGQRGLVLLVDGVANIAGILNVSAREDVGGPGGYGAGAPSLAGSGPCGGLPGDGTNDDEGCVSGGGGGGHAGMGGHGGDTNCGDQDVGGLGGPATCGTPELVPLVGGSGGAGGVGIPGAGGSTGSGGGGGGAVQISASGGIVVAASGGINAGGAGGGGCTSAGGSGGGAGGAVLLESPTVSVEVGGVLAANGGGGGGGDCT